MPTIQFTKKQIELAKPINTKILKCSINKGYLRIGKRKITKLNAIKFAKWILKSFNVK